MKQFLLILTLALYTLPTLAQVVYGEQTTEDDDISNGPLISQSTAFTDYEERLFIGIGNSLFLDFISSPLTYTSIEFSDPPLTPGGPNVIREEPAAVQTNYSSVYTVSFEPRYNLLEPTDNFAFAATAPISIGFGQSRPTDNSVQGAFGFGNWQLAMMASMYYGNSATKRAEEEFGFNLSAGYEVNKIGVINLDPEGNSREINKAWIMPTTRIGVQFYRGYTPVEVYVKYGFGPRQDQLIDGNGNNLNAGKSVKRASSLKLAIVYTIN